MDKKTRRLVNKVPDFDVLAEDPDRCALIVREKLEENGFKHVSIVKHDSIDDVIPKHIQIIVGKETLAFIFEPVACHNYNTIQIGHHEINVATIDTMLSLYLAFLYSDRPYYNQFIERILCMSKFLFDVQQKNRLSQKGLLKRFSINCMGHQETIEEMRAEKANKFNELKDKKNSPEYEEWFLRYRPSDNETKKENTNKLKNKTNKTNKLNKNKKQKTKKRRGLFF
jgi:hypothetical protein